MKDYFSLVNPNNPGFFQDKWYAWKNLSSKTILDIFKFGFKHYFPCASFPSYCEYLFILPGINIQTFSLLFHLKTVMIVNQETGFCLYIHTHTQILDSDKYNKNWLLARSWNSKRNQFMIFVKNLQYIWILKWNMITWDHSIDFNMADWYYG